MVVITSFKKSKNYRGDKYSIARFQPKGFVFPTLQFFAAVDTNGEKLTIDEVASDIDVYEKQLLAGYKKRWNKIKKWLDSLEEHKTIVLCCWCPYSNPAKAQLRELGKFCCHSGLVGQLINKYRPDITILLDDDRKRKLISRWQPEYLEDEIC